MVYQQISRYLKERGIDRSFLIQQTSLSKARLEKVLEGECNLSVKEYLEIVGALHLQVDFFSPVKKFDLEVKSIADPP